MRFVSAHVRESVWSLSFAGCVVLSLAYVVSYATPSRPSHLPCVSSVCVYVCVCVCVCVCVPVLSLSPNLPCDEDRTPFVKSKGSLVFKSRDIAIACVAFYSCQPTCKKLLHLLMMMMFIGTETSVTQFVNERSGNATSRTLQP